MWRIVGQVLHHASIYIVVTNCINLAMCAPMQYTVGTTQYYCGLSMHGYIILCITYTVGPLIVIEFSPHIYSVVTITSIAIVGVYTHTFRLCAH